MTSEDILNVALNEIKENRQLKQELAKYKRAFEILKDMLDLEVEYDGVNPPTLYVASDEWIDYDLTLDEAELLEELFKNEEDK